MFNELSPLRSSLDISDILNFEDLKAKITQNLWKMSWIDPWSVHKAFGVKIEGYQGQMDLIFTDLIFLSFSHLLSLKMAAADWPEKIQEASRRQFKKSGKFEWMIGFDNYRW